MRNIVSVKPKFGTNYKVGYVGFTFKDNSFISKGIAWFTRWEKGKNQELPKIDISHVVVVTGENECIEATSPRVTKTPLSDYFNDPHMHICFRKPVGLTEDIARRMIAVGERFLGKKYDYVLLFGHLLTNNVAGRLVSKILGKRFTSAITSLFNSKERFICSEYVATMMNEQFEYNGRGVLKNTMSDVDPQELFQDTVVFTPWTEGEPVEIAEGSRIPSVKRKAQNKRAVKP
jgi:hypothetical protein